MKFKWRARRRFLWGLIGKRWTKWHEATLDEFVFKFEHIPEFNSNEKHPEKTYWIFQFKDFVADKATGAQQ